MANKLRKLSKGRYVLVQDGKNAGRFYDMLQAIDAWKAAGSVGYVRDAKTRKIVAQAGHSGSVMDHLP